MAEEFEIRNRIAESGLINLDIAEFVPKGARVGIDIKDFLFEGLILREKDFREKVEALPNKDFADTFVYIYNSADAIVPLWAYFLLTSKLAEDAKRIVFGSKEQLEILLLHESMENFDFSQFQDKRILVKGCTEESIPENAYVELIQKLKPVAKSLMFGEACSNVPIFKK